MNCACDCSQSTSIFSVAVIIIGWVIVHVLSVKRDKDNHRRKEAVNIGNQIVVTIREIKKTALDFHKSENFNGGAFNHLKFELQMLESRIKRINAIQADNEIKEFRQAITLNNVESSIFKKQNDFDRICIDIDSAATNLIEKTHDYLHKIL